MALHAYLSVEAGFDRLRTTNSVSVPVTPLRAPATELVFAGRRLSVPMKSPKKNRHAVALGRLGGEKGGPARAKALSARRRREIATHAGLARAGALTAAERKELARRAALARWAQRPQLKSGGRRPPETC
jgi:hypothetical protein